MRLKAQFILIKIDRRSPFLKAGREGGQFRDESPDMAGDVHNWFFLSQVASQLWSSPVWLSLLMQNLPVGPTIK